MDTKRIAKGYGKKPKWVVSPEGPHPKEESIPLTLVLRDILDYADNGREANFIVNNGRILVDKKKRKDANYGIGLMDVIEIPEVKKYFRVLPGEKRLELKEIKKKEVQFKLCKVEGKKVLGEDEIQLNFHDGSNILVDREQGEEVNAKDTLKVDLASKEIEHRIEFEEGNEAMIVRGKHSGEVGKIKKIREGTQTRPSLAKVGDVQTLSEYVFVLGEKEPIISV